MSYRFNTLVLAIILATASCGTESSSNIDGIAESYVTLALSLGEYDADYVDAYFGPEEWRDQALAQGLSVASIRERGESLLTQLGLIAPIGDELELLRFTYLEKQLGSLVARAEILGGQSMSFDEESLALYDAVAPHYPDAHFEAILSQIDSLLPGPGSLFQRYETFIAGYQIPPSVLDEVFQIAIHECRARTAQFIDLPAGESFTVEYVQDKPWSGYNWYQGDYRSLIQVNTDVPRHIGQAVSLACHEGYPGHHVYSMMLEHELVNERGWPEYSVYPLFSPQSLIAEDTANFGIELAFPREERVELAGLDPSTAHSYHAVEVLVGQLNFADNEAARMYLDGEANKEATADWLVQYAMIPVEETERKIRFYEQYRSYIINYNLGQELVRGFVDGDRADQSREDRWARFQKLLASPRLPGDLVQH
jgi:hypothetical protein